jgi:hypothetical protein
MATKFSEVKFGSKKVDDLMKELDEVVWKGVVDQVKSERMLEGYKVEEKDGELHVTGHSASQVMADTMQVNDLARSLALSTRYKDALGFRQLTNRIGDDEFNAAKDVLMGARKIAVVADSQPKAKKFVFRRHIEI